MTSRFRGFAAGGRSARILTLLLCLAVPAGGLRAETVRVGVDGDLSDLLFYLAEKRGYFAEQGLTPEFVPMPSESERLRALGDGRIAIAGNPPSALLFAAIRDGAAFRIVADKGSASATQSYLRLIAPIGGAAGPADLKGRKIAETGQGGPGSALLAASLAQAGLVYSDVQHVFNLPAALQGKALGLGAIAAGIVPEPYAHLFQSEELAIALPGNAYPRQHVAVLLYGGALLTSERQIGGRFMRAYLAAATAIATSFPEGRLSGPDADEMITLATGHLPVVARGPYEDIVLSRCDLQGAVDRALLARDIALFVSSATLPSPIDPETAIDSGFAEEIKKGT